MDLSVSFTNQLCLTSPKKQWRLYSPSIRRIKSKFGIPKHRSTPSGTSARRCCFLSRRNSFNIKSPTTRTSSNGCGRFSSVVTRSCSVTRTTQTLAARLPFADKHTLNSKWYSLCTFGLWIWTLSLHRYHALDFCARKLKSVVGQTSSPSVLYCPITICTKSLRRHQVRSVLLTLSHVFASTSIHRDVLLCRRISCHYFARSSIVSTVFSQLGRRPFGEFRFVSILHLDALTIPFALQKLGNDMQSTTIVSKR